MFLHFLSLFLSPPYYLAYLSLANHVLLCHFTSLLYCFTYLKTIFSPTLFHHISYLLRSPPSFFPSFFVQCLISFFSIVSLIFHLSLLSSLYLICS